MKKFLSSILTIMAACLTSLTMADDHVKTLNLELRQPVSTMEVTSIHFGEDETTISAQGDMGAYGKVYASYDLSYDPTRNSGGVKASGRGFADGQVVSGYANGVWTRDGDKVVMSIVVMMNDGSQNLEEIVTDPMTNKMTIHTYALK